MRRSPLPIALFLAVLLAAVTSHLTGATFSVFFSKTENLGSTFQTAASFGCATPPTTWFLTGFEHGKAGTAGGALFNGGVNGSSGTDGPDAVVMRTGGYSMKMSPTAGQAFRSRGGALFPATQALVQRFALRLASLPSADVKEFAKTTTATGNGNLRLGYKSSTQHFTLAFGAGTTVDATTLVESNVTVQAGTWYVIDIRHVSNNNPNAAHWRIDGSAQPSTSIALAAQNLNLVSYGSNWSGTGTDTYSANYDDIIASQTSGDYPIGDGHIRALKPNASGTHNNPGSVIQMDTSVAVDSTTWNRLDDVPLDGLTDYVKQTATSGAAYGEFAFENTTQSCVRAVRGYMTYDPLNSGVGNNGKTSVFDGTTESIVYSGAMTFASTAGRTEAGMVTPATSPWTQSAVNGLVARIGYSGDANPNPRWTALMLEVDSEQ